MLAACFLLLLAFVLAALPCGGGGSEISYGARRQKVRR
jgi:hypothetical protein